MKKGGVTAGWVWLPVFALIFFWAGPAATADDAECLNCHKDPKLSKEKKDGSRLSLHVDGEVFKSSVHGAAGLGCAGCHQGPQAAQHPPEAFPEVACLACHADPFEAYQKTSHGMMRGSGMENAPKCADCHTAHAIRKAADPLSPVGEGRLPSVCASCHWQATPPAGILATLATYRIMGHPKGDLGEHYDLRACAKCHPENSGHPQKPLNPTCVRCHDKSLATPLLLGPLHVRMDFKENPLPFVLRILYGFGAGAAVLGAVGFFGYRTYRKKRAPKPEAAGEEVKPPESGP